LNRPENTQRARVAVVDDDEDISALVAATVQSRGHEAIVFEDGAEALLAVPGGGFDLVITDLNMPRLDGLSFVRALRACPGKKALPVLVLSARDRESEIVEAFEAGATDYLVKPFQPPLLLAKLGLHLGTKATSYDAGTPMRLPTEDDLPRQFGNLRLTKVIGIGNFGVVYQAEQSEGPDVALKLLHPEMNGADVLARYFREVASLSLLDSPYVVSIHSYGLRDGLRYLLMDFVDGGSVAQLRMQGPLSSQRAAAIGVEVVRGLKALHAAKITHRDIKPGNILLHQSGHAVLADLGLAKRAGDHSLTETRSLVGTLEYVAPEVIEGQDEGMASDLYSLGATLYALCADRLPYPPQATLPLLRAILAGKAPRLVEIVPGISRPFSTFVAHLMHEDPLSRPSLDEAERELQNLAQDET